VGKQKGGVIMEANKIFITRFLSVTSDEEVNDMINQGHLTSIFDNREVMGVLVLKHGVEMTVGRVNLLQRALRSVFRLPVLVIY